MSEHVLSILVKAIGASTAAKDIKSVDSSLTNISRHAKAGASAAIGNMFKVGAIAATGLGAAVMTGVRDLATLEDSITSVNGAIKTMGLTGKVTGAQVSGWANQIESDIHAAFDDKDITHATATLIRFGSVTPANLKQAMVVMTDLAAKTGDVDSAATLLSKALAAPEKAAGKLARTGVVLTKAQQDQIKTLVKAGKTEQAQAILLDAIAKKTKGAADATAGPYRRALNELSDASEDARKALAEGFLPIIERVADWLHKKLADPAVIAQIRGLGKSLADGFDKLLSIVGKIPWDSVASAMKIAGTASKAILDAFVAMPAWVQTAILTGWGLNKLTGGALSSIIGDLGAGLIKGVLGMTAGVVNIKAGVVNGAGGLPGGGGAGGGLASLASSAIALLGVGAVEIAIAGVAGDWLKANVPGWGSAKGAAQVGPVTIGGQSQAQAARAAADAAKAAQAAAAAAKAAVAAASNNRTPGSILDRGGREKGFDTLAGKIIDDKVAVTNAIKAFQASLTPIQRNAVSVMNRMLGSTGSVSDKIAYLNRLQARFAARGDTTLQNVVKGKISALQAAETARLNAVRDKVEANRAATVLAGNKVSGTARKAGEVAKSGGDHAAAAIARKKMSVTVPVSVSWVTQLKLNGQQIAREDNRRSRIFAIKI